MGENLLTVPAGATKSTVYWEGLPKPGEWYRLWMPAYMFGIEGTTVTEFSFAAYDGQVWFDRLARVAAYADVTRAHGRQAVADHRRHVHHLHHHGDGRRAD